MSWTIFFVSSSVQYDYQYSMLFMLNCLHNSLGKLGERPLITVFFKGRSFMLSIISRCMIYSCKRFALSKNNKIVYFHKIDLIQAYLKVVFKEEDI